MYCTALDRTVLYCTVLYCTVLYCTVLYCTVVGTPQYMAPEAIANQVERREMVDFWALGCCMHFFTTGVHLFDGPSEFMIMCKIEKFECEIDSKCPKECKEFIDRLVVMDPKKRLGYHKGADDLRQDEFFRKINVDFRKLLSMPPPLFQKTNK
mmetsp:Transcript_27336/g.51041  ORF Transcript_27336/g.51041 Transcript_27336/m.51041 type:complete len:153 (-) Transcript_27336:123-581(-)